MGERSISVDMLLIRFDVHTSLWLWSRAYEWELSRHSCVMFIYRYFRYRAADQPLGTIGLKDDLFNLRGLS